MAAARGGTATGFLTALYQDLLGRDPDLVGQAAFSQALANGAARSAVAGVILTSMEARRRMLQGYYERLLGRSVDVGGLEFWLQNLQRGAREEQVVAGIAASAEYRARA